MSSITGLAASTSATTPLQRAEALAKAASAANPGQQAQTIAQATNAALATELATQFASSSTSYGPAYDISTGVYDYTADTSADDTTLNIFDQIGASLEPQSSFATQWQQITTPSGNTPGESQSVAASDQISYKQSVTTSDVSNSHAVPNLGTVGNNAGRLVVLGSLSSSPSDEQTYSFNVQQAGQLRILAPDPNSTDQTASLGPVHMQVFDSSGNLFADSDPTTGQPYLNYVKLDQTVLAGADVEKGQYTVKLSYNGTAPANAPGDYSLFIEEGSDPGRVTYYTAGQSDTASTTSSSATSAAASTASAYVPALSLFA